MRIWVLPAALLLACESPPQPRPPATSASSAAPMAAAIVIDTATAVLPVAPARATDPLPPATRRFELVLQPLEAVLSLSAASDGRVWLLGEDNRVVVHDGSRVASSFEHVCAADPQSLGNPRLTAIHAVEDGIVASASYAIINSRSFTGAYYAFLAGGRGALWACDYRFIWSPLAYADDHRSVWVVEAPHMLPTSSLTALHGAATSSPKIWFAAWARVHAASSNDVWVAWGPPTRLAQYNGFAWVDRPPPPFERVVSIWADGAGAVWAAGGVEAPKSAYAGDDTRIIPADRLARFDGAAWRLVAAPPRDVTVVVGTGPRDVWFFGEDAAYQWDGESLRATPLAIKATQAIVRRDGELWVAGKGGVARGAAVSR